MDDPKLDPGTYVGSYKMIGGRPSLDFINTVSWPDTDRQHDWFDIPDNVLRWAEAVGIEMTVPTAEDLRRTLELRAIVRDVIMPLARGQHPVRNHIDAFNSVVSAAVARRRIDPVTLEWFWPPTCAPNEALDPVVFDAARVVVGDRSRLKHCPSCDWVFEDHTRNGKRRWCDMRDCGSRAKSRAYYHRSKANS